jgi:hypothetical protein
MTRDPFGKWHVSLPPKDDGTPAIPHQSRVKVEVHEGVSPMTPCFPCLSILDLHDGGST